MHFAPEIAATLSAYADGLATTRQHVAGGRNFYDNPFCAKTQPNEWHAWTLGLYGRPAPTMTREAAFAVAQANERAHSSARIAHLFRGAPEPDEAAFGYRHGWYAAGGFNFRSDELTPAGPTYDLD